MADWLNSFLAEWRPGEIDRMLREGYELAEGVRLLDLDKLLAAARWAEAELAFDESPPGSEEEIRLADELGSRWAEYRKATGR